VEYKSKKIRSIAIHKERAWSTESYREKHDSLDISASISGSASFAGVGASTSVSGSYAEANTLITNNKNSGSWKASSEKTYQDGHHIFRNVKTFITIDGVTARSETEDHVNTSPGFESDQQLRERAIAFLKNKYPGESNKIRGTSYDTEFCTINKKKMDRCCSLLKCVDDIFGTWHSPEAIHFRTVTCNSYK